MLFLKVHRSVGSASPDIIALKSVFLFFYSPCLKFLGSSLFNAASFMRGFTVQKKMTEDTLKTKNTRISYAYMLKNE